MRPCVTPAEFAALTCNRCGACCTRFHLAQDPRVALARERGLGARSENDGYLRDLTVIAAMVEHLEDDPNGGAWYCCRHFRWDEAGQGCCTIHAQRPQMCRGFPYGRPVPALPTCSWNVRLVVRPLPVVPVAAPPHG